MATPTHDAPSARVRDRPKEATVLPTLAEVLHLDAVRRGQPEVLTGADRLDARVRWVHAIELADAARLLRGGELVLATGIGLPETAGELAAYAAELAAVGACGLVVELGRRYLRALPRALVDAAHEHGLPLIVLARETPFVEITEAVHARIIDAQSAELRASEHLHEVFTGLAVAGARTDEIVRQAATLAGKPAVLESRQHQVLACEPGAAEPADLLTGWEARARAVAWSTAERTLYDAASGWLMTIVGARGEDWGRLILVCGDAPQPRDTVVIERAATTLALTRLLERQRESLEREAHRTLLAGILAHAYADPEEAAARARALGLPVAGRQLLGVVVAAGGGTGGPGFGLLVETRALQAADATTRACRDARIPALVGSLDDTRVGALLALPRGADADSALSRLAGRLRARLSGAPVLAAGSAAMSFRDVRQSFLEAMQVADAAIGSADGRPFYRMPDLRLRGLLRLLRDDARVQSFTERELGALLAYDDAHGTMLTGALAAYLAAGGNKAAAAARAGLARPTLYQRLRQIEKVLGTDLGPAESRLSLHVALLALEAARADRSSATST